MRAQLLGEQGLVANLEDVARELAISPRGLRRKLRAEGTTFRHVLEEERRQLAMQLLGESDITLDEVAAQLGYADTASFNRAFRRWLDISPGGYRNQTRST